jgi:SAM-dependent methyltransferase
LGQTSALDSAALGTLCPVCEGAELRRVADAPGWGSWLACAVCSHEFVDPLEVDGAPTTLFGKAYKGTESRSAMDDFAKRVSQRDALISDPKLWFWSPAFDEILAWLHEVTPGGVVLEIGCGLGFFLHALRREGFDARGLDVADLPVELNRRDGFEVWHGTLDTLPEDWCTPDAVVALFMLHHVADPVGLLADVRRRWPTARVAVAQYGPAMHGSGERSSPPRTLHRWNGASLGAALERAGYSPLVSDVPSTGVEAPVFRPLRRIQRLLLPVPAVYRMGKRIARRTLPRVTGPLGQKDQVITALAEPRPSARP